MIPEYFRVKCYHDISVRLRNISACVQKYRTVFLVPLLGNTTPSDDAKKRQQCPRGLGSLL
jgi:hypothetical protein